MFSARRIKRSGILLLLLWAAGCKKDPPPEPWSNTPYEIPVPSDWPVMTVPADNPTTVEGIALGRRLFYDPILSGDSTQSCAGCHAREYGFSDHNRRFSTGIDQLQGNMNAMQIINPGWATEFFWNGRSPSMEHQAAQPVLNPIEMHESWENAVMKLQRHPAYPDLFYAAFETRIVSMELATKAIAQFERTFISSDSRYDLYARRDPAANFTQSEFRGYQIFFTEKGDCFHCHANKFFTDHLFHNNGLDSVFVNEHQGRYAVTGNSSDMGKFKVPSLRNIEVTGPYMHDGRFATLEEVVEFYNSGVKGSATVDPIMTKAGKENGLQLTAQEKTDLVAFLKTLTDTAFLQRKELGSPF